MRLPPEIPMRSLRCARMPNPGNPQAPALSLETTRRTHRDISRAIWRRWSGDHRRSRVETTMHCIKLLGQSLMARGFDRQVPKSQIRIAALNRDTALSIPGTEAPGQVRTGKGGSTGKSRSVQQSCPKAGLIYKRRVLSIFWDRLMMLSASTRAYISAPKVSTVLSYFA